MSSFAILPIPSPWARRKGGADGPDGALRRALLERFQAGGFPEKLPDWARREFSSLQKEVNLEILGESLVNFGRRLLQSKQDESAAEVFSILAQPPLPVPAFSNIQRRAHEELSALTGHETTFGRRAEFLTGRFPNEVGLAGIAGAAVGFSVFTVMRAGFLSRLLARPGSWWTRGFTAQAMASSGAFLFEVPTFLGATKFLHEAVHGESPSGSSSPIQEILGAGIMLGGMKLTAWGMVGLGKHPLFQHVGTLAGLWAGDRALKLAFSNHVEASGADLMARFAQFTIAAAMTRGIFGSEWASLMQELNLRASRSGFYGRDSAVTPHRTELLALPVRSQRVAPGPGVATTRILLDSNRPFLMAKESSSGGAPTKLSNIEFLTRHASLDFLVQIYREANKGAPLNEKWERYYRSRDPEERNTLVRLLISMLKEERYRDFLERSETLQAFRAKTEPQAPYEVAPAETAEWLDIPEGGELKVPSTPPPSVAEAGDFAYLIDEGAASYTLRMLSLSQNGPDFYLPLVHVLLEYMKTPHGEPFFLQTLERMAGFTKDLREGSGIVIRRQSLGSESYPLTVMALPSTFSLEQWARYFGETGESQEKSGVVITRGSGWMLINKPSAGREGSASDQNPYPILIASHTALKNDLQALLATVSI